MSDVIVTVSELGLDGSGIAIDGKRQVSVRRVFPGETARIEIQHVEQSGARAFAVPLQIITPHPGRRQAPCVHHDSQRGGQCAGCPLQQLTATAQREIKLAQLQRLGLPVETVEGDPDNEDGFGYRWSSKRVARTDRGALLLGSRIPRSERIAEMRSCLVDHPRIVAAFAEVESIGTELGIRPFDRGIGDLRYVWAKTNGEDVLLTLITADKDSRAKDELAPRLAIPVGVAWSVQSDAGNVIRGTKAEVLRGVPTIPIVLGDTPVDVGPLDFLQPNPKVALAAYRALTEDVEGRPLVGSLAFDLYAGTGVTTNLLRRAIDSVIPSENYPDAAARLGIEPEPAEKFLARAKQEGLRPDVVIANPPRGGVSDAVPALLSLAPPHLRIMSCEPRALARDLQALAPHYRVVWARAFDTLPHTAHVEVVVGLVAAAEPTAALPGR